MQKFIRFLFIVSFSHFLVFSFAQNVGIGLLSPVAKLHVKGSADVSQLIIAGSSPQSNTSPLIRLRDFTGADLMWIHSDHSVNTFIGVNAGRVNLSTSGGLFNTFVGGDAGNANTTGSYSASNGYRALYSNTTGIANSGHGSGALYNNAVGSNNTANGHYALYSNVAGSGATAVGYYAMRYANDSPSPFPSNNVAVGYEALRGSPTPSTNTGINNTALGYQSLKSNSTGYGNTGNGYQTLYYNTTGIYNTSNGFWALYDNNTGNYNTAIGTNALQYNLSGSNNTATGYRALWHNTTASSNTANGNSALYNNTSAGQNTAIGTNALYTQSFSPGSEWSSRNVAVGNSALYQNQPISTSTGINNTAIGNNALFTNITGSKNTAIGFGADVISDNLTNATAVGYNAKVAASNALVLGGTGTDAVNVGIGTTTPNTSAAFDVSSTTKGFLPPRMTIAQRDLIANPVAGLLIWCTNCGPFGRAHIYDGYAWTNLSTNAEIGRSFQGGILAYILQPGDPGYDPNVPHGLIAASSDQSTEIQWYNGTFTITGATGTALGTGQSNTTAIVNNQGAGSYAAQLCNDLVLNGYSDWYLPSKDELSKLYLNKNAIGGFDSNDGYWSSSEVNINNAWFQIFNLNGEQANFNKSYVPNVRAVRTF